MSTPSFRSPAVTNPCDRKKCEWLCLLSPSGPVCTCPNGKRLDNGTCVPVPSPTPPPDGMYTPFSGTLGSFPRASGFPDPWSQPSGLRVLLTAPRPGTCTLQCFNGGSCFLNVRRQPKCRCQPRYTGDKCELDQCSEYCQNGGTCAASPSGMPPARLVLPHPGSPPSQD